MVLGAVWVGAARPASGGEIYLRNGDKITGEIVEVSDGSARIRTAMLGEVLVPMENIATFSIDSPVVLRLRDGSVVRGTLQFGKNGAVSTTQPVERGDSDSLVSELPRSLPVPGTRAAPTTRPADAGVAKVEVIPPAKGTSAQAAGNYREIPLTEINSLLPNPAGVQYRGNIRAGLVSQRGNSDTDTVSAAGEFERRTVIDRFQLSGDYNFSRETSAVTRQSTTSTDNWTTNGKYDYFLNQKLFVFGLNRAEADRIAQLEIRVQPGAGLGYQWIEGPSENLRTEGGFGATYEDYTNRDSDAFATGRLAYAYDRRVFQRVKFISNAEYLPNLQNSERYQFNTVNALRLDLVSRTFTDLRFEWRYNSDPAPGARPNDFRYLVTFGWEF